jgi:protein TonB
LQTSHRHLFIAASVVLFHLGALWALQTRRIQRVVAAVLPAQLLSEFIKPPQPKAVAQPKPLPPINAPVAATPVLVAAPKVALPSSDADYLQNLKPAYPANSRRLGEQGKAIVRVLIGADGAAHKSEIRKSSGFERLDQAALATVQRWRYVPGKRGGVPESMWFSIPINFVLE